MLISKDSVLFCMEQPLSLIYALYFQKCNSCIASSKSETCKLSKKLRYAIHAGEQTTTFVRSRKLLFPQLPATLNCHNGLLLREKFLALQSPVNLYFVTKPLTTEESFRSTAETWNQIETAAQHFQEGYIQCS